MLSQEKVLEGIRSLSPTKEHWVASPEKVTVTFKTGQTGILDMKNPVAVVWADIIDRLAKTNRPVYVEVDEETRVITHLLVPTVDNVNALSTDERGDVEVRFIHSPAIRILLKSEPNFDAIYTALQSALDEGAEILITETDVVHEIIDARPPPAGIGGPPDPGPAPPEDDPIPEARAQELFHDMNAESCIPCTPASGCIPFKYPDNGCQHRAHKMCKLMIDDGEAPEKVWLRGYLPVPTSNHPYCQVTWGWHVAPTLEVIGESEKWTIDPALGSSAESFTDWKNRQGDPGATAEHTAWTQWDEDGREDPDLISTNYWLAEYAELLHVRCLDYGPPPYSCTRRCFFIIDRNTFSEYEVEAMINTSAPALIEAAFYITIDGYSPYDLGFSTATMEVVPNLDISPTLSAITITPPVRMEFEDPIHLNRRQRLTWIYDITFSDTSDFSSEVTTITLNASLASVSDTGYLYLIQEPNPYEIDGETSWLSTDLRVFQINAGRSKFGADMDSDPNAFITQVINNLNTNNAGGETFEDDISEDQQESELELSTTVDGTRVYNFAIAKVRYRAESVPAENVRVFFRLFPFNTTTLDYDQGTTYRRYEEAERIVPLLGIKDGRVVSIPCFASPRINSAVESMTNQPDDEPNVQPSIPPDASGEEVVRYFGCWLDFNQTEPQFPVSPPEDARDGRYTSDRQPIQEHIMNEHQCLVSEIVYTPTPIQSGHTPSVSDKLAQRNLAIVPLENPGSAGSRRIPQTFEIRPTRASLEHDELMFDWGNVPPGSIATIYLPGFNTYEIMLLARKQYLTHRLVRLDEHTLRFETGGITYLPIPFADGSFPCLLTVDLPEGIEKGEVFKVVVRQVTGEQQPIILTHHMEVPRSSWRHIVGSFQLTIPVRDKAEILPKQQRLLSNLRWIERSIPETDRWFPVFRKYVGLIAARVDALGGDSTKVAPSASGQWQEAYRRCQLHTMVTVLLIAIILVGMGTLSGGWMAVTGIPVFALFMGAANMWKRTCRPTICQLLRALLAGTGIATIILVLLAVFGFFTLQLMTALVLSFVVTVATALASRVQGCWKMTG